MACTSPASRASRSTSPAAVTSSRRTLWVRPTRTTSTLSRRRAGHAFHSRNADALSALVPSATGSVNPSCATAMSTSARITRSRGFTFRADCFPGEPSAPGGAHEKRSTRRERSTSAKSSGQSVIGCTRAISCTRISQPQRSKSDCTTATLPDQIRNVTNGRSCQQYSVTDLSFCRGTPQVASARFRAAHSATTDALKHGTERRPALLRPCALRGRALPRPKQNPKRTCA